MTTKEMIRCKDCCYLVEGNCGEWCCSDFYADEEIRNIHDIDDEDCPLDRDY